MWRSWSDFENRGRVQRFIPLCGDKPMPYAEVLRLWSTDEQFRSFFTSLLVDVDFAAFRWETPPITAANADRDFQFVLLNAPSLDVSADSTAFASHFSPEREVVAFPNLGGDALLVVPCPASAAENYGHLGSFLRSAPRAQVHRLWQMVGQAMQDRIGVQPVWLNTAGMGVSWVHVRLDSWPKYYGYLPYKTDVSSDDRR